jgi:hypothetical protein
MAQSIVVTGLGTSAQLGLLRRNLSRQQPSVLGIAAAFVSIEGVRHLLDIQSECGQLECRLVAGTDNAVTHPEALYLARDSGWRLRLGKPEKDRGIFHPKLLVAGRRFTRSGLIDGLSFVYAGSANVTVGGLKANVECGFVASGNGCLDSASAAFARIWTASRPATNADLRGYAAHFAEQARRRPVSELKDLGVSDSRRIVEDSRELLDEEPPAQPVVKTDFAVAAWAGLQSFTGEYRFQVEFPRDAGEVIGRLVHGRAKAGGRIDVYCPDDSSTRPMQYRFYADNGMFRLNVPNDVPGVIWARANHRGLALVEKGPAGGAALRLRILKPGAEVSEVVGRSAILGTWGRTSTRSYGWC